MLKRTFKATRTVEEKRRLVRLLRIAEPLAAFGVGLVWILYLFSFLPPQTFTASPATGGDTGSHLWPLVTLIREALPNLSLRTWNPGNLGGEPHLVHYFPMPYLFMAVMAVVFPIGMSFNIGTLLGAMLIPFGAMIATYGLGYRYGTILVSGLFSGLFLYNEGYSMWGGNVLSMLAGQFAHQYAIFFLLSGVGFLAHEIRYRKWPIASAASFAGVATSHAYILLIVPVFAISILVFYPYRTFRERLICVLQSGIVALLLSLWFLVPMLDNSRWNTAFSMEWNFVDFWNEIVPPIIRPTLAFGAFSAALLPFLVRRRVARINFVRKLCIWLIPASVYVGYYFLFPKLGLVDVRAIPQTQLFVVIAMAILYGEVLSRSGRLASWLITPLLVFLTLWWTDANVKKAGMWITWNYSGWTTKLLHDDLSALHERIRGSFSDPRVIFEHADYNNATGTTRVFEMLPYFANRSTTESLYMQSTILAMQMFHLQFEVSKTPSCPLPGLKCESPDIEKAKDRLDLMGVGEFILQSEMVVEQAHKASWLEFQEQFGPWSLFRSKEQPTLVDTFSERPEIAEERDWRELFYQWFKDFRGHKPFLIAGAALEPAERRRLEDILRATDYERQCAPRLEVNIGKMELTTNCPGVPHYLKFAFHPTFAASSGDQLFPVSPGFIGIVPTQERIVLRFGQSLLWRIADWISLITVVCLCLVIGYRWRRRCRLNQ